MKYGNLKFNARGINSIGDNMQLIAIDNVYTELGIPLSEIVYLDFHDLANYDGEYVVLPLSMPMVDYIENGLAGRFSPRIIPVFLGLNMVRQFLYPKEIDYLRMYEPVGCRDEIALQTMRKYNIKAYLHGCITFTLPERKINSNANKVYIVDAEEDLVKMLPSCFFEGKEIVYKTHSYKNLKEDPKILAIKQYEEYKENAILVITGLLHCALPCFAAGIPVLMLNSKVSYRKAFLESLITIWTPEKLLSIKNCNEIQPSIISDKQRSLKEYMLKTTKQRILNTYNNNKDIYDLSYFFENRNKNEYVNDATLNFIEWIKNNWTEKSDSYNYCFWGMSQVTECLQNYIKANYPNSKLLGVYDTYKTVKFENFTSQHPENIKKLNDSFVFISAEGASPAAKELELKLGNPTLQFVYKSLIK